MKYSFFEGIPSVGIELKIVINILYINTSILKQEFSNKNTIEIYLQFVLLGRYYFSLKAGN